jgi:hypothetical protein
MWATPRGASSAGTARHLVPDAKLTVQDCQTLKDRRAASSSPSTTCAAAAPSAYGPGGPQLRCACLDSPELHLRHGPLECIACYRGFAPWDHKRILAHAEEPRPIPSAGEQRASIATIAETAERESLARRPEEATRSDAKFL